MKHAELVAFRIRKHLEALVAALADVGPNSTEAEQSFDLCGLSCPHTARHLFHPNNDLARVRSQSPLQLLCQ